jgi:cytochrome c-type biogenesis protein CcmF
MEDFTVSRKGETFQVAEYTFKYNGLREFNDDHMSSVTADVDLFDEGSKVTSLHPERRQYVKGDGQMTTEVDVSSHIDEDVYIVLTGYQDPRGAQVANFRIYINPLINWVWLGFGLLMLGTMLLLIPQRFIDGISPQRRTRAGKATEAAILLLIGISVIAGLTSMARAEDDQGGAEYSHNAGDGTGYAHECRPNSEVAKDLMQELVCTCGGCQRESLYQCKCGFAAERRCEVLEMLGRHDDIESEAGRKQAYDKVIASFVEEHGERVRSTPKSNLSWGVPVAAAGGALLLIFGFGRMWVRRGKTQLTERSDKLSSLEEDDQYGDILDDELRETD